MTNLHLNHIRSTDSICRFTIKQQKSEALSCDCNNMQFQTNDLPKKKKPRIGGSDAELEKKNMNSGEWSTTPRNGMRDGKRESSRFYENPNPGTFNLSLHIYTRCIYLRE